MSLPQSVLDEPSAGCCELEYGYKNAFGAREVYGPSPTQDSPFGGAMKTGNAMAFKSSDRCQFTGTSGVFTSVRWACPLGYA